jgi:excisionase family DNA binding protein
VPDHNASVVVDGYTVEHVKQFRKGILVGIFEKLLIVLYGIAMATLTTQQAAEALGMTVQGVHALIRKGNLRAQKLGRDYLLSSADVERVKSSRPPPGRPPSAAKSRGKGKGRAK